MFQPQKSKDHHLKGILLMLCSIVIFSFQDIATAFLSRNNYPVPFFVMIRYWVFLLFATGIASHARYSLRDVLKSRQPYMQIARALLLVTEIGIFSLTLRYLKLAELQALFAASPLIVTALSVPLLKEQVGWRRWSAVVIGFIGVLIVIRPSTDVFQSGALLGLLAASMYACYTIMTRFVSQNDSFITTYWYTAFFGAVCMTLIGPFYWAHPDMMGWLAIATLCILGTIGHFCLIRALEHAPASTLQPLAHLQIFGVSILGYLFFDEWLDLTTIIGAVIIVSSGMFIVWREQQLSRKARERSESPPHSADNNGELPPPISRL